MKDFTDKTTVHNARAYRVNTSKKPRTSFNEHTRFCTKSVIRFSCPGLGLGLEV